MFMISFAIRYSALFFKPFQDSDSIPMRCPSCILFFAAQIYTKLDGILTEFAAVDWTALADKVDSLDLETLNEAISDFSGLISPLAKLFGVK